MVWTILETHSSNGDRGGFINAELPASVFANRPQLTVGYTKSAAGTGSLVGFTSCPFRDELAVPYFALNLLQEMLLHERFSSS